MSCVFRGFFFFNESTSRIVLNTALVFVIIFFPVKRLYSRDRPYINVGQAEVKQSPLALVPFIPLDKRSSRKSAVKYGQRLYNVIKKDLTISSYFSFIPKEAFIEDYTKRSLYPKKKDPYQGFDFLSWEQIGVEFMIRSGFKMVKNQLQYHGYVYHVPQKKLIMTKTYTDSINNLRKIAHRFSNDVVKSLTGRRGFFNSKFVVSRSTKGFRKEIYVMDWDGANQRPVTNHRSISQSPAWSPSGRYLTYTSYLYHKKTKTRNADLFIYDIISGKRRLVSYQKGINSGGVFTPDSRSILLRISKSGVSDIYRINLKNLKITQITNGPRGAMNVEPVVSPDGKTIAFSSDRSGKPMIYTMDMNGGNVKRLTFAGVYNSTPAWSPDGRLIAFSGFDRGHFDIFVIDSNGRNIKRLTSVRRKDGRLANNENPSFSPDGRFILFSSDRTGRYQLYIVSIDGKHEYRLTFDNKDYYKPQWSPYLN